MTMSPQRAIGRQARIREFDEDGLPDPPLVIIDINADTVRAPSGGNIAGRIGPVKHREGNAFIGRRRFTDHFYRDGRRKVTGEGGYAISRKVLHYLLNRVYHICIYETDRNRTLEFGIDQYVSDGKPVRFAPSRDPQVFVPIEDARHIWNNYNAELDTRKLNS